MEFKAPAPVNVQSRQSAIPSVPYEKPDWSGLPKNNYTFEVIKGGISIDMIDFPSKEFLVLGPEEPQQQIIKPVSKPAPETVEVTWGFAEDAEDESELSITEAKESWKRDENAYYYKDPKKALRNWFENRGYDMEFESEQEGPGHARTFTSRIQLPDVEDAYGPVYGIGSGPKKRDADRQAAIDACEKLDMLGILRGGHDEACMQCEFIMYFLIRGAPKLNSEFTLVARKKRLKQLLGDDLDDNENDSFYDRTGQADRANSRKSLKSTSKVETYESLTKQREELALQIEELQNKISIVKVAESEKSSASKMDDDLENFMESIKNEINNESEANLQEKLQGLLKQDQRLNRLIQITKPHEIMKNNNPSLSYTPHEISRDSREHDKRVERNEKNQESIEIEKIKIVSANIEEISEHHMTESTSELISSHHESSMIRSSTSVSGLSPTIIPSKRTDSGENDNDSTSLGEDESNNRKKKVKSLVPMTPQEYEESQRKAMELNELEVEDAIIWEPPQGQSGDGRTALNDKFGY
ncbi:3653_t:CDS:10 [Acaulospora morrowiae]|uniref:3653_t:CDS:1 n=1 Tax=Acaulospora morrowiae TaxID=94023 RepID=A0A9N9GZ29_9GLOM|nr:3653_t:CDS:10 [Acaulospora morrowiae]